MDVDKQQVHYFRCPNPQRERDNRQLPNAHANPDSALRVFWEERVGASPGEARTHKHTRIDGNFLRWQLPRSVPFERTPSPSSQWAKVSVFNSISRAWCLQRHEYYSQVLFSCVSLITLNRAHTHFTHSLFQSNRN